MRVTIKTCGLTQYMTLGSHVVLLVPYMWVLCFDLANERQYFASAMGYRSAMWVIPALSLSADVAKKIRCGRPLLF